MTKAQSIASLAAIGGLTAVIALQTGLPAAQADELADLRANQQLLQARIDQLAQAQAQAGVSGPPAPLTGGAGGGSAIGITGMAPAPGTPSLGGSFPRSFLIPGTDTSIRIGGFVDFTALEFLNGGGNINGSNYGSNSGQNGALESLPLSGGVVPGAGFVAPSLNRAPPRNNGILEFSPQQSRIDIETRTPTAWGEARTFFAFDWAGCDNYSCQTLAQGGGNSILTRLRFAYGTLGGFLAGQALSNFSDADADTESLEFGNVMGSTGGQRIPQVRYTIPGPYGSAFSVSAENPWTTVITPGGVQSSDWSQDGIDGSTSTPNGESAAVLICNGVPCTGTNGTSTITSTTTVANPTVAKAPSLTFASYWAQPWGHVDVAGLTRFYQIQDGRFIDQKFVGYGGHIAGDVHPGWWGFDKDDFLASFVIGTGIGNYASGGEKTLYPLATNFTVTTACATPTATCTGQYAASNILVNEITGLSIHGGYEHWWLPNLRTTVAAGYAGQEVNSQLIGPSQAQAINKRLWNAFVNLVWNPVAFITTGVEYMYGKRVVVANLTGNENVLIYKFRVAF
ncbi:MAG TPA: DcaP family trimeric outer membrane transporter [Stellaceae bacterium]|nr:DcaP family trimeric outer membrane transporter [Stellaceae bacterium]